MDSKGWIPIRERPPNEQDGEIILVWHVFQGTMAVPRDKYHENRFYSHWRAMPAEGWIDAETRLPTKQDSDVWGCVLTRHEFYGFKVTGWHQFEWNDYYTHWMHTPEPPDDYIELRNQY